MKKCRLFKIVSLSLLVVLVLPIKIFADTCSNGNMGNDNLSVNLNNNQYGVNANGGSSNLGNYIYSSEEIGSGCVSSSLYCITPDGGSQGGGMDYSKVDDLSEQIRDCTNSKTGSEYCGMAGILQVAYGSTAASDAAQSNNWNQMDAAVTMALRLWAARNPQGTTSFFSDEHYDGAITKAANILFDKIERGESVSPSDVSQYLTDKEGSKTLALAIEWYQQAVKGVDLKRADNFIQNTPSVIVGENGVSYEYKANSSNIQGIGDVTVEGVSSDQIKFEKVSCSDGSGDCYTFSVSDEAIDQLCKGKPAGTTISYSVKVKSNSAINKMYLYKPSKKGGNQYFVGFNAYDEDVSIDEEIECPDSSKKCVEDPETGKCYGPNGEEIDCDKMEEVCGPCIIEDGKCYRNEEEVDCDECDICVKQGDNCFVAGQQVDCEDYPECEDTCEKRGDKCYVGEKEVPCEDYPECTGICERNPGEGCTLGGVPVDCNDYEECKDLVCHKEGDTCYLGEGENKKVVPCGAYPDPECQVDEEENPDFCSTKITYNLPGTSCMNGNTEGTIEDPPMCSILKDSTAKGFYKKDYAQSNSYCNVYCREKLTFEFMDKETAQAGRYFRHHITAKGISIANLSTVVTSMKQCTSEINYDKWKAEYIALNSSILSTWNSLKEWEAYWSTSGTGLPSEEQPGGGCTSECESRPDVDPFYYYWRYQDYGQTRDDGGSGYNFVVPNGSHTEMGIKAVCVKRPQVSCPAGVDGPCYGPCPTSGGSDAKKPTEAQKRIVINTHNSLASSYLSLIQKREEMIQQLYDCNFMQTGEVEQYYQVPGQFHITNYGPVQHDWDAPLPKTMSIYDKVKDYNPGEEAYIDYEENTTFGENYEISEPFGVERTEPEVLSRGWSDGKTWEEYCGSCGNNLDSISSTPNFSEEDRMVYWYCTGSLSGARCTGFDKKSEFPNNRVADMRVEVTSGHYQSQGFSTELFTGEVITGSSSSSIPLLDYSWPVGVLRETGTYAIDVDFENLGDPERPSKIKFDFDRNGGTTCAYDVVNEMTKYDCDDDINVHDKECYDCDDPSTPENECYPNGEPSNKDKIDLGFYFRSIDLDDVFPNSIYSPNQTLLNPNRPIGSNWNKSTAKEAIIKIQDLGEGYLGGGKEPEYSVTLTPAMRKQISKNNREKYKGDYLISPNSGIGSLTCYGSSAQCFSTWLQNDLRDILEDYNHGDYYVQNDNSRNNLYVVGRN